MRLGEADRIITLYTPDRGKVRAVVKGARRAKSRKGGFLQPLTHVRVSMAEGRSLDQVVEAEDRGELPSPCAKTSASSRPGCISRNW